jgi:4-carboxymuconolactone decarboxylase
MTSEKYERGTALLASMGNDPEGLKDWRRIDPVVGPEIERMLGEFCFGDVWSRDGLDLRTRRIITLTSLATQNRMVQLEGHIRSALEQGFERREILEVFTHLIAYGGFPTALSSIGIAMKVFDELDAAAEAPAE